MAGPLLDPTRPHHPSLDDLVDPNCHRLVRHFFEKPRTPSADGVAFDRDGKRPFNFHLQRGQVGYASRTVVDTAIGTVAVSTPECGTVPQLVTNGPPLTNNPLLDIANRRIRALTHREE